MSECETLPVVLGVAIQFLLCSTIMQEQKLYRATMMRCNEDKGGSRPMTSKEKGLDLGSIVPVL